MSLFILYKPRVTINYTLLLLFTSLLFSVSCSHKKYTYPIRLDEIPFSQIINYYGPPKKNMSFSEDSIRINSQNFTYGLGTHAPSDLRIPLNRQDAVFEAIIGIDIGTQCHPDTINHMKTIPGIMYDSNRDSTYPEPAYSAVFRVFADERMIYESPVMNRQSKPMKVRLSIKNAQTLRLVTDPHNDGSVAVSTNWAMAVLKFREDLHPSSFFIYSTPEKIMFNQSGYKHGSHKKCVLPADVIDSLYIYCSQTNQLVFKCTIDLISGDLGKYLTADFSDLNERGNYYLYSAGMRSEVFEISDSILKKQIRMYLEYIDSISKFQIINVNNPLVGKRSDNGNLQRINQGWYDMYDAGWSAGSSVQLLYSLSLLKELNKDNSIDALLTGGIASGNSFLFSMLEPEGYLMHSVNFPDTGNGNYRNNENRKNDNIVINTYPASFSTQFLFALTQARLSRLSGEKNETQRCKKAAEACFHRAALHFPGNVPCELGIAIGAACELYKLNKSNIYKRNAEEYAGILLHLMNNQSESSAGENPVFFMSSPENADYACPSAWTIAGLCMFVNTFRESSLAQSCKDMISNGWCKNILYLADRNAYNLIPMRHYDKETEGCRTAEEHYYSLFNPVINSRYPGKGNTSHITSTAAVLIMTAETLNKPELVGIAQRQLDWVLGCNPFSLSFVSGSGSSHPSIFRDTKVPLSCEGIKGGVMAGISSDKRDSPVLYPGWKPTTSYCNESLANVLWLTILLDK